MAKRKRKKSKPRTPAQKAARRAKYAVKKTAAQKPVSGAVETTPYPDSTAPVGDFEKTLDGQLKGADGTDTVKRGRGRPPKDKVAVPEIKKPDVPAKIIEAVLRMPFDLWGTSQKQLKLKLTDDEAKQLTEAVKPLLDYYVPYIPEIGYAWVALVATTYWIARPRFELIAEIKKAKKEKEKPSTAPVSSVSQSQLEKKLAPNITEFPKDDQLQQQHV